MSRPLNIKRSDSGHKRRETRKSVRVSNAVAHGLISLGGVATILAVLLVCVFLVSVVIPLFLPPDLDSSGSFDISSRSQKNEIEHIAMNEFLTMGWMFHKDGTVRAFRLDSGRILEALNPFGDRVVTAAAFAIEGGIVAFGFEDGGVQYGTIDFETTFLNAEEITEEMKNLSDGSTMPSGRGMVERTSEGQYRRQEVTVDLLDPMMLEQGVPIYKLDISMRTGEAVIAALSESRTLHIVEVRTRKNLLTGKTTLQTSGGSIKVTQRNDEALPSWVLLSGLGDNVYIAWTDGRLLRYNTRDLENPALAEKTSLTPEMDARLTSLTFQIGKASLISGDSMGRVRVWFHVRSDDGMTRDGSKIVLGSELKDGDAAVTSFAASARTRMVAVGYSNGRVRLFHVTSKRLLGDVMIPSKTKNTVSKVAIGPKDDALLAYSGNSISIWAFEAPNPETTFSSIFLPVWYEGYSEPAHVWQTSSSTDDFEPKYGMVPLIFGTIKATIYSILFGLPLALLAAVYTSEMMNPKLKMRVKPLIEMMASLPSVVLGFLAALVVAPFVENIVPEMLLALLVVPFSFMLGAYLWQLLPGRIAARIMRFRVMAIAAMLALGIRLSFLAGPLLERVLFAGEIKQWLAGSAGSGVGAWMFILLPMSSLVMVVVFTKRVTPWVRRISVDWSEFNVSSFDFLKFLVGAAGVLAISLAASYILTHGPFGWWNMDPRGTLVDTYIQRNALIVGFIMGFAIIPIIYTISEDALSAVPEHLRSASLASGATPWQTAVRIIIPTAASGLFSAMMIGLGRAVGETMIVLMATGNTPVLDWNIFNGFRTLSANIAVELPEAVKDSTHYRMLFLCALVLFVMTFILNTVAEMVRQRFRRKAFEL